MKTSEVMECKLVKPCTRIAARVELGKDNALYIRGHGEGLRWDRGQPLACVERATWVWSASPAHEKVEFHILLDDQIWARGDNLVVEPGRMIELRPDFEWPEIPCSEPHRSDYHDRREMTEEP
jgi:hypothetical protein